MSLNLVSLNISQITFLSWLTHCSVFLSHLQADKNFLGGAYFSTLLLSLNVVDILTFDQDLEYVSGF